MTVLVQDIPQKLVLNVSSEDNATGSESHAYSTREAETTTREFNRLFSTIKHGQKLRGVPSSWEDYLDYRNDYVKAPAIDQQDNPELLVKLYKPEKDEMLNYSNWFDNAERLAEIRQYPGWPTPKFLRVDCVVISNSASASDQLTIESASSIEDRGDVALYELVNNLINRVFTNFSDEEAMIEFEDDLARLIRKYGRKIISAIEVILLVAYKENYRLISDILPVLGSIQDPSTIRARKSILVYFLENTSPYVRDAAVLGLAHLGDPESMELIKQALSRETNRALKVNFKQALDLLREMNGSISQKS